jgi:hypothetical protein
MIDVVQMFITNQFCIITLLAHPISVNPRDIEFNGLGCTLSGQESVLLNNNIKFNNSGDCGSF